MGRLAVKVEDFVYGTNGIRFRENGNVKQKILNKLRFLELNAAGKQKFSAIWCLANITILQRFSRLKEALSGQAIIIRLCKMSYDRQFLYKIFIFLK